MVIAILAILGGVAVPAYSGYITKANRVADEQLLADLNKAFAAACNINGEDHYGRNDNPSVTMTNGAVAVDALVTESEKVNASFATFFEGGTFKVITELFYNPSLGCFAENKAVTFSFGGKEITLSAKDVAILSGDNAFSNRGSAALLSDVGALETYLGGGFLDDSILTEIGASDEFMSAFAGYLGLKQEDYENEDDYWIAYEEKLVELEASNPNATTNALIMYAASSAGGTTTEEMSGLFTYVEGGALTSRIEGSTNEETMANAALAYGMYTAYAQHNGISSADPSKFTSTVNTKEFADYVASAEGQADLEAYMAAMNMISDNTGNPEVTNSILNNGITGNQDLADLMKEVMGS